MTGLVAFVKLPELELETPVLKRGELLDAPDWYGLSVLETAERLKAMLVLNP